MTSKRLKQKAAREKSARFWIGFVESKVRRGGLALALLDISYFYFVSFVLFKPDKVVPILTVVFAAVASLASISFSYARVLSENDTRRTSVVEGGRYLFHAVVSIILTLALNVLYVNISAHRLIFLPRVVFIPMQTFLDAMAIIAWWLSWAFAVRAFVAIHKGIEKLNQALWPPDSELKV